MESAIERLINELPPLSDHEHEWGERGIVTYPAKTHFIYWCDCGAWGEWSEEKRQITFRGYVGEK